jgi:hypothetical protein
VNQGYLDHFERLRCEVSRAEWFVREDEVLDLHNAP